jgi:hypothetical protein
MIREPNWRRLIWAAVAVTVAGNFGALVMLRVVSGSTWRTALTAITVTNLAIFSFWLFFNSMGWRFLQRTGFARWPDLNGKWKGEGHFTASMKRDLTKAPVNLNIELGIRQTYNGLWVDYECSDKGNARDRSTSFGRGELKRETTAGPFTLRYAFDTQAGSATPNSQGLAILTYRTGSSEQLRGEWVCDVLSPEAGHLEVTRASSPALWWPV